MKKIDYNRRKFRVISNSNVKDVGSNTVFEFCQEGEMIYGKYQGGEVKKGHFIALVDGSGSFERSFQHVNQRGKLISGKGIVSPELSKEGKLRLKELWKYDTADKGAAILEELDEVIDHKPKKFNWLDYLVDQKEYNSNNLLLVK